MPARRLMPHNWPAVVIALMLVAIACVAVLTMGGVPPRLIVMATGPEGGTYHEAGQRYHRALARENVEVQLLTTAGSVENLATLLDPSSAVSVALIQGGTAQAANTSTLVSLGTVFYEPFWWFQRREVWARHS